jgi:hypothetical protein
MRPYNTITGAIMDKNENKNESTMSFGEELGKTFVYSAAASAGILTGVAGVLLAKGKFDEFRINRQVKKATKKAS